MTEVSLKLIEYKIVCTFSAQNAILINVVGANNKQYYDRNKHAQLHIPNVTQQYNRKGLFRIPAADIRIRMGKIFIEHIIEMGIFHGKL